MHTNGTPLNPTTLIEKLEAACDAIDEDRHRLYDTFSDLVDYVRLHQSTDELLQIAKDLTDPQLKAGDVVLLDDAPRTVRSRVFHGPHKHPTSGLPPHQPVLEIVTSHGSRYLTLVPQA
ncbi:hypothetical protein [Streptomyces sp. NPDC088775]|uniref:hypothetical protein n=1 Tax=Streptomyces sp. NPDC088775 TaxID=3365896 RepID=UPI0037FC1585